MALKDIIVKRMLSNEIKNTVKKRIRFIREDFASR